MSRAGSVADGTAAAVEMPKPRMPGLGRRIQDSGATVPLFSEQLDALEAGATGSDARANPATAAQRETREEAQKRQHPRAAVNVVEPGFRPIPAARRISFPLEETDARDGQTGAMHQAIVDDTAAVQLEAEPLEKAGVAEPSIGDAPERHDGPAGTAAQAGSERAGRLLGTDARDVPEARPAVRRDGHPNRKAAGRADVGASGVHPQPHPATSAPARHSPATTPATVRAAPRSAADRQTARAGDVPLRIVRQESHYPPVERLSPAAQIANAVAAGLQRADEVPPVRIATGPSPEPPRNVGVVRVLHIRLEPPELGTVSVRMKLDANALEVRIDARLPGTADLIRSDQGALSRLLQSAGYDVEGLSIHVAEPDRSAASSAASAHQSTQSPSQQSAFQAHSGNAQPDGRSGGADRHANRQNETAGSGSAEPATEPPGAGMPGAGGVYV